MNDSDKTILQKCTSDQKEKVRKFLEDGWRIDVYDGDVCIVKGFSYKIVMRNGSTVSV
jgi:hypothetical protein